MKYFLLNLILIPVLSFSQYGILDETFGNEGIVLKDFLEISDLASFDVKSVLTHPSGKIYIIGNYKYGTEGNIKTNIYLARFHEDGNLDISFGENGFRILQIDSDSESIMDAIIVENNKILLVGGLNLDTHRTLLIKINLEGEFDNDFGNSGIFVDTEPRTTGTSITSFSDNSLFIGIIQSQENGFTNYSVLKLFSDGTIDSSFGNIGRVNVDIGSNDITQKIIMLNNKILLTGESLFNETSYHLIMIRFNLDGTLDSTFGNNGIVDEHIENSDYDGSYVGIKDDGTLLVSSILYLSGDNGSHFCLINFNEDGSLNINFGLNGYSLVGDSAYHNAGYRILFDNNSNPIITGYSNAQDNNMNFAVLRFNQDGTLDNTFGQDGIILTDLNNNSYDWSRTSVLQNENKIILAGKSDEKIALVRYLLNNQMNATEQYLNKGFTLIPNPTSNSFVINGLKGKDNQIQILDLSGKLIQEFKSVQDNQRIDLRAISKGIYLLRIKSNGKTESKKLIVK